MKPILFNLGPIPITSWGVFLLLAFAVGITMARRRGLRLGIDPASMLDLCLYMIIGGLIAGRLGYVLANLPKFLGAPGSILAIWRDARDGGMVFYGALLGAVLIAALYARSRRIALLQLLDIFAPALAIGYAVGMIGALLTGLYLGTPTGVPWAVDYVQGTNRHPTQVYLLIASLGTYLVIRGQERRGAPPGALFFTWLLLFALGRVTVELFVDSTPMLGPLTLAQVVNIAAAVAAIVGLVIVVQRPLPEAEPIPPASAVPPSQGE